MPLALTVVLVVFAGVIALGIVGYLVDRSADRERG
jgi:preprotein translocase subunit Sss1